MCINKIHRTKTYNILRYEKSTSVLRLISTGSDIVQFTYQQQNIVVVEAGKHCHKALNIPL